VKDSAAGGYPCTVAVAGFSVHFEMCVAGDPEGSSRGVDFRRDVVAGFAAFALVVAVNRSVGVA
jgi:hypothetical protein